MPQMCLFYCGPDNSSPLATGAVSHTVAFHLPLALGRQINTGKSLLPPLLELTAIMARAELQ